nr:MAG TPA: tail protein [Caudoviricetes sp.]
MIDIYNPDNTDYEKNGNMTLAPTSATVHAVLNKAWEAKIIHPIDSEGRWKYIKDEAVVKMPSFNGVQMFRVKHKVKTNTEITAYMEPVFMDARNDCWLMDVRPTEKTGQQALDIMVSSNKKYHVQSNIAKSSTAYYVRKNLIEALNGDDDNAFVKRWGGEIIFDNYKVIVNERAGRDNGLRVSYGRNIPSDGISEDADFSDVITRLIPIAYNGYMISGDSPWVDSPLIHTYPTIKIRTMSFDDVKMRVDAQEGDSENGVIICDTQSEMDEALRVKCNEQYKLGLDKPKVTLEIDLVMLQNTESYKEYADLESVFLGDTVHCDHSVLDITTDGKVIELEYDSLRECVTSTVIGDYIYNYFDNVTSVAQRIDKAITSDGMVIGEQVKGIIDGIRAMMRTQANNAHPSPVRSMIFEDLVEGSPTYGALCLGTMGFQIANKRTADGKEWDWRTFGTGAGFFADLIVAGTMLADRIRAGKLQSQDYVEGKSGFELNLDTDVITSYGSDDSGNASKLLFEKGGIIITNLATGSVGKVSIRYQKVGDSYFPIISGTDGEQGYSMNQNSLIYMMGTLIKASMGITGGKGYVNTDTLNVRESIMSGNRKGISQVVKYAGGQAEFVNGICVSGMDGASGLSGRAEFSDGSYMQFENGLFVGGYTTEGGGIS